MPRSSGSGPALQEITSKLSADDLVKRLKANFKAIQDCESLSDSNTGPLTRLASSLIEPVIRHHKSRDVRLLAACCIAEIFTVFFPDPPYDEEQLKIVFSLFVSQLQGLEKPSSPSFKWSFQLLESLASMKAFNLCFSIDAGDILTDLFKMIFSIVNNDQSTKVKMYLLDMMSALLQEGESISQAVLDTILMNIIEPIKSENKSAYTLAVDFIKKTSSFLEPYIQLFFNNALVVGKSAESEVGEHLYDLILELNSIDSSVLLSVTPQLEFKLKSNDTEERLEVTRLLARMFSPRDSRLAIENKPLWLCFLGRYVDVSPSVRVECVKFSKYFLVYHRNLVDDTAMKLHERFHDREEKVRLETVKAVCEAAADNMQAIPQMLFDDLQERMRDKSWVIRKEAMTNIARLYRQIMSSSFSSGVSLNKSDAKKVSWMANKILHSYYQSISEDRLCVVRCVLSCLVPVSMPDGDRMERLTLVYSSLDEHAARAFDAMLKGRHELCTHLLDLIRFHQDDKMEADQKKQLILTKVIQLARGLPEPVKAQAHLQELVGMLDDEKLREALQQSLNCDASCQEVTLAKGEVVRKIGSRHNILDTIKALLDRSCPMLVDARCVSLLVERVCGELCEPSLSQSEQEEMEEMAKAKKAVLLIKVLAGITPSHFGSSEVFQSLLSLLRHDDTDIACRTLQILVLIGKYIDPSEAGCLQPVLTQLAQKGAPELAKYTIRCTNAVFKEPKPIFQRLFTTLTAHLDYDHPHLHTTLISLAQLAKLQPGVFETKHKIIIRDFIVKKLLVVDKAVGEYQEGVPEWCREDKVSYEARTKILGLKLLVAWLLGLQSDYDKASQPVVRLLDTVLAHDGDLQGEDNISAPDRSRLRLAAACGMLKLARNSHYHDLITLEQFQRLALTMQDTCDQVRDEFASKLNKGLKILRLPLGYLSVFALAGIEPRKEARIRLRQMVVFHVEKRRELLKQHSKAKEHPHAILPEYALSHTIHLLAHHPDFSRTDPRTLDTFKDCLWFFLEPLVHKSDNYGFLRKLIETIKQTVDAQDPTNAEGNKNLYAVCDLTLGVLTTKLTHIKIGDFPGSVVLPTKLFKSRGKNAQTNDIVYLPPDYDCTPTKRGKGEDLSVTLDATAEVHKPTSSKRVKSPQAQPPKAKTSTKQPSRSPRGKAVTAKGKSPKTRRRKAVVKSEDEMQDSGVSDVEDKTEKPVEQEEEEETPSRGKKRGKTTVAATRKRNVRRKVLQEPEEDGEASELTSESQDQTGTQEEKSEASPLRPATSTTRTRAATRTAKRKVPEEPTNKTDHQPTSESQSETEDTAPSHKKRKTESSILPEPSISVKRKARRRK